MTYAIKILKSELSRIETSYTFLKKRGTNPDFYKDTENKIESLKEAIKKLEV